VEAARVGCLATVNPSGALDVAPITFALLEEPLRVVTAVDHKPKRTSALQRLTNLRADPRATVLIDHYADDWTTLWWVRLRGRGAVVTDGPLFDAAVDALVAKYLQYSERRPAGPAIVVTIDAVRTWSATEPDR
jgi:PPOX class probable F420-dependent enzyme